MAIIAWFEEVDKNDIPLVGGKGANLGEMTQAGIRVPGGYNITMEGYDRFVEANELHDKVQGFLKDLDVDDTKALQKASKDIRDLMEIQPIPDDLEKLITEAYDKAIEDFPDAFVAVRSSATAEDLPDASFAGQQETFLNVKGHDMLLDSVKKCWSSLWTPRAIFYRVQHGFSHEEVKLSVVVQRMVNSFTSGIMFTSDVTLGKPYCLIEGGWGLGEMIVSGTVTPDTYVVKKADLSLHNKIVQKQLEQMIRDEDGGNIRLAVEDDKMQVQKIPDEMILEVAKAGINIEEHYGRPMDVEWAVEDDTLYILQARPVTTEIPSGEEEEEEEEEGTTEKKILLKGLGASPGQGIGKVVMVKDMDDLPKVKKGDILVTVMTTPDMVPAMVRSAGIVTNEGGMTCHAAIVSRELGIPCVVGTSKATEVLKEGMTVTVEGKLGQVYEGKVASKQAKNAAPGGVVAMAPPSPVTATKVYLNLAVPDKAEEYSKLPVDGVGLLRLEFIFINSVKEHPVEMIKRGEGQKLVDKLAEGIGIVCEAMYPRPVIVRLSDFKTNEYRDMPGGEEYEPEEENPMIGWRGCSRYISDDYREAFRHELMAFAKVRNEMGLINAHPMLPFVRAEWELREIIAMMEAEGLHRGPDYRLYMMAEVPSNIFMADVFSQYIDGFSIGSNDLTQLIMGADRDSRILGQMGYFDERNPAVTRAISHLIKVAHANGVTVGICGQAPSVYPEFSEFLVREGIDTISLNHDTVIKTKQIIASAEQKVLLERLQRLEAKMSELDEYLE
jgi:pyruvate,water dikinase